MVCIWPINYIVPQNRCGCVGLLWLLWSLLLFGLLEDGIKMDVIFPQRNILLNTFSYTWKWILIDVPKQLYKFFSHAFIPSYCISGSCLGNESTLPYRMICGCIFLAAGVLVVVYSAIYTAQLTVPRFKMLVQRIEDVSLNPAIAVYVTKGSPLENYLLVCIIMNQLGIDRRFHLSLEWQVNVNRNQNKGLLKSLATRFEATLNNLCHERIFP